jgi:hypothetical protein
MECGSDPREIDEALTGRHTYAEYRALGGLPLVLCDFCFADFSSYDPTFFGLPTGRRIDIGRWEFVREVQPVITKDKCCVQCGYRLPFLEFVVQSRKLQDGQRDMTSEKRAREVTGRETQVERCLRAESPEE